MRKILLTMTVLLGCLALSACSNKSSDAAQQAAGANMAGADGVSSSAMSSESSFNGIDAADVAKNPLLGTNVYYFTFDSSTVKSEDLPAIKAQAGYLIQHPNTIAVLAGHTDEKGSREYNIALGERRGVAVQDIFLLEGVSRDQIQVVSYGEEKPADLGHDEQAYEKNRRVEINFKSNNVG